MRTALFTAASLFFTFFATTALGQNLVTLEIMGTWDTVVENGTVDAPTDLPVGEAYTLSIVYSPDNAEPDSNPDPLIFVSMLDPATTAIEITTGTRRWRLPSSDPSPSILSVVQSVQSPTLFTSGSYEVGTYCDPAPADFPYAPAPEDGDVFFILRIDDPDLWTDTVLPATEHISDSDQIDLAAPAVMRVTIGVQTGEGTWFMRDVDPAVLVDVTLDPVRTESVSWSGVKAQF